MILCFSVDCEFCPWMRAWATGMREVRDAAKSGDQTALAIARRARSTSRAFLREYPGCRTRLMAGAA